MTRYLVVIMMAIMITVPVRANDWWMPSPVSIALTVGQWLIKDREQVYYLRVRAQGRDEKQARDQAFRLAVEQAIGALILAETEIRQGQVNRDAIISYSSGFVHDFAILERRAVPGGQEIVVDVWVARSHLADRLLSISRTNAVVEGGRVSRQIETFQHSRSQGDRVLTTVLNDFPQRAFTITLGKTQVLVNEYRQPVLSIWMEIDWSRTYLESLDEAVARTSHAPECDSWLMRQNNECRAKVHAKVLDRTGFFDDQVTGDLIHRNMALDPPRLSLRLLDRRGTVVYTDCITPLGVDPFEYHSRYFYQVSQRHLTVDAYMSRSGDVRVDLSQLSTRDLDRVEAEMVRRSQCPEPWRPR
jgi:hypothetical protein